MLDDDGDLVKALGYVSMYSAWLEEDVDDLLRALHEIEPFDEATQRWPISRKLRHTATIVRRLSSDEVRSLPHDLEEASDLFERRNEVIHGRVYAGPDQRDYLQSGRPDVPTREITSAEVYQLANEIWGYRGAFTGPPIFRLPRAIAAYLENRRGTS